MGEGDEDRKLRQATQSALILADENGFKSVSVPAISSGIFRFPKDRCASILVEEAVQFLTSRFDTTSVELIEFCIIDSETLAHFKKEFAKQKQLLETRGFLANRCSCRACGSGLAPTSNCEVCTEPIKWKCSSCERIEDVTHLHSNFSYYYYSTNQRSTSREKVLHEIEQ